MSVPASVNHLYAEPSDTLAGLVRRVAAVYGSLETTIIITMPIRVGAPVILPATVHLEFSNNGSLDCENLYTVAINSPFPVAPVNIFINCPPGLISFASTFRHIKANWWRAATADLVLNAALTACPYGGTVDAVGIVGGAQVLAASVSFTKPVTLLLDTATFTYAGAGIAFDILSGAVNIFGTGRAGGSGSTLLALTGTSGSPTAIGNSGAPARRGFVHIADLFIDGVDTVGSIGIALLNFDVAWIERVEVQDFDIGIFVSSSGGGYYNVCEGCIASSCKIGFQFSNTANSNTLRSCRNVRVFAAGTIGVLIESGNQIVIDACQFEGHDIGVRIANAANNASNALVNNRFESASGAAAIEILGAATKTYIAGNYFSGGADRITDTSTAQSTRGPY